MRSLRPDRPATALRRVGTLICASLGVLASPAFANSTLSYPANGGPLTITANDPGVTITVNQIIEVCQFCDTRLVLQSPQRFTTANPSCADSFGDGAQFECRPLPSRVTVTGSGAADAVSAGGVGGTGCSSPSVRLVGLGGPDTLSGGCAADELLGGDARDTLVGGDGADMLDGGADTDELHGGAGPDVLLGGEGRDTLVPGLGVDVISGGTNVDTVSYDERATDVSVSIGAAPADGAPGENDDVGADVENIVGGSGADSLTGDADSNDIDGGPGADVITPGAGSDVVDGGVGPDTINALDGVPDTILCGDGADSATVDAFDVVDSCETTSVSRELMSDVDNDGLAAAAGDCQDRDPSVRPGLPDKAGDGIDSDCVGGDAGDVDNDGLTAAAGDCQDRNPTIRLGLPDRPGDGIDSDCVGGDTPYPRVLSGWVHAFDRDKRATYIRYTKLDIIAVPEGATLELACRGRGCFKGVRRSQHPKGASLVRLARHLRRARLRPRAVLEIRVTKADTVGKVIRLTTQRGRRQPVTAILCLKPGVKTPVSCRRI